MEVMAALRSGQTAHPTIKKFWTEEQFQSRLGIQVDPRPLPKRPFHEVDEYLLIMRQTVEYENAQKAARS